MINQEWCNGYQGYSSTYYSYDCSNWNRALLQAAVRAGVVVHLVAVVALLGLSLEPVSTNSLAAWCLGVPQVALSTQTRLRSVLSGCERKSFAFDGAHAGLGVEFQVVTAEALVGGASNRPAAECDIWAGYPAADSRGIEYKVLLAIALVVCVGHEAVRVGDKRTIYYAILLVWA